MSSVRAKLEFRPWCLGPPLLAGLLALFVAGPLAAAEMVPHRAVYSLKMGEARPGGAVVDVSGLMTMTVEKSCDGWILAIRRAMKIVTADGGNVTEDMRFAGWESANGDRLRFASRVQTGAERRDYKGEARLRGADGPGEAVFKQPEAKTMKLPEGTLFPLAHTALLIDRARAGARQVARHIFDGTEIEGAQEAVAFIGPRQDAPGPGGDQGPLVARPGWNMRLAVYGTDKRQSVPQFEIEFLQLDNGVVPRLMLDFKQFTVLVSLEKVESPPAPSC